MSSYGKNQKKKKEYFGEMGQKEQFWPKTVKFGPKKSNLRILAPTFFRHFLKDQKMSSYGKNQKNLKQRLGEMRRKIIFGQKRPKKSKTKIFDWKCFSPFFKKTKKEFLWQKSEEKKISVWEKQAKKSIFGQKQPKFGQKVENDNFRQKSETSQI